MVTILVKRPTKYTSADDPGILIALLRDAIVERTPVYLVWMRGNEPEGALVQPTAIDPVALWTKVRVHDGAAKKVALWEVCACETLTAEGWEAA